MSRFTPSFLDEIRNRIPVSQVVGRRVQLKKQGREFAGLSPFNKEKTPSFTVNDDKRFYHCFSSGKHGDIFTFLMEVEGLSFPEAVERLANEAGLQMPKPDPRYEERERARASLYDVVAATERFFVDQLQSREGRAARDYLEGRGVSREMIEHFRIGFAPDGRSTLKTHLAGKGIDTKQMIEAGVIIGGEDIAVPYDRFRDRVIFPITDLRGRPVAFGGRALSPDAKAKYLNSPETPLFHKGDMLFNLAHARPAAHRKDRVFVVEGYLDVVAMTAGGFAETVAPLGTALTENQLALLWRMVDEPVLCFDGDAAGARAARRALELALPHLEAGKSLSFVRLPPGRDPDDVLREQGASALEQVLERRMPLVDLLWSSEYEAHPADTPERRAAFETRIRGLVRTIRAQDVRRHYEREIDDRLSAIFAPKRFQRGRNNRGGGRRAGQRQDMMPPSSSLLTSALVAGDRALPRRDAVLALCLLNHPELAHELAEDISASGFAPAISPLVAAVLEAIAVDGDIAAERLRVIVARRGHQSLLDRIDRLGIPAQEWWAGVDANIHDAETGFRHTLALHRKLMTLHTELSEAEAALERETTDANFLRIRDILAEIARAEGTEALVDGFGSLSGRTGASA